MKPKVAIRIDRIGHVYEARDGSDVPALRDVSLDIRDNEFVAVVGPSGCGKSTLLRIIGGLVRPSSGRVEIDGTPVTEPRSEVGIIFQTPTLLPWTDVLTNVVFPLKLMHRLDSAGFDVARDLLRLAGLSGFERKTPQELSGGMQQRVALCRALVFNPRILLMDEPFGALDALTREELSIELMRICAKHPKTIYFVTHSISEAVLLADRVVVMTSRPGRIAEVIDINLPRPRSFALTAAPGFIEPANRIRQHIFGDRSHADTASA